MWYMQYLLKGLRKHEAKFDKVFTKQLITECFSQVMLTYISSTRIPRTIILYGTW